MNTLHDLRCMYACKKLIVKEVIFKLKYHSILAFCDVIYLYFMEKIIYCVTI